MYYRVLSAAVGIPVFMLAVWLGGWAHFIITAAIMFFSLFELNKLYKGMGLNPHFPVMVTGTAALLAGALWGGSETFGLTLIPVVFMLLLTGVFGYPSRTPADVAAGLTGTLYIGLFVYFYIIRTLDGGLAWVLILLAGTWASDTLAYFVGKKFGKRKLAPGLSPGKTIEGALGGIAGSILVAVLVYRLYPLLPLHLAAAAGLLVGITGTLGDLFESSLKRTAGLKDTGAVIPGHGGVLDRFDSMLFTAPALYYFAILW